MQPAFLAMPGTRPEHQLNEELGEYRKSHSEVGYPQAFYPLPAW